MKNTDLIAAVGGIEKAQKIVDRAPDGADSYVFWTGKTRYINSDLGEIYSVELKEWAPANIMVLSLLNSLSGLRTAIAEHDCAVAKPEFKVGDLVVFNESHYFAGVYEIEGWSARGILDGEVFISGGRRVHELVLRHATLAEIKAGHRLNPSNTGELETLEMIDISPNTVVINESN